jgi:hypothetical protein
MSLTSSAYTTLVARYVCMPGCIVYAGEGWSEGVLHMLRASPFAAYSLPGDELRPSETTRELDHLLAMHFGWWDILTNGKQPLKRPRMREYRMAEAVASRRRRARDRPPWRLLRPDGRPHPLQV